MNLKDYINSTDEAARRLDEKYVRRAFEVSMWRCSA